MAYTQRDYEDYKKALTLLADEDVFPDLEYEEFKLVYHELRAQCQIMPMHKFKFMSFVKKTNRRKKNLIVFKMNRVNQIIKSDEEVFFSDQEFLMNQRKSFQKEWTKNDPITGKECLMCRVTFKSEEAYNQHLASPRHVMSNNYRIDKNNFAKINNVVIELIKGNGNGHENYSITEKNQKKIINLEVTNNTAKTYKFLDVISLNNYLPEVTIETPINWELLEPGVPKIIKIHANFTSFKADDFIMVLELFDVSTNEKLNIIKSISFVMCSDIAKSLMPTEKYVKPSKKQILEEDIEIVPGLQLNFPSSKPVKHKINLKQYAIPKEITAVLNSGFKEDNKMSDKIKMELSRIKKLLQVSNENILTPSNYVKLLDFLIYAEEHQMKIDIRDYDMTTTVKKIRPNIYSIKVPGLAEKRPSVLRGDTIHFKQQGVNKKKYEGIVHEVKLDEVILGFSDKFSLIQNEKVDVSFSFNRRQIRCEHQALELLNKSNLIHILFPKQRKNEEIKIELKENFNWFNKKIADNEKQKEAVNYVFNKSAMPYPYIIFGPPGTGKTSTLVEAVLQIWKLKPSSKVLVCAPSNYAVDVVAKRLVEKIPLKELLRIVGFCHVEVPQELKACCNLSKAGEHYEPNLTEICSKRIILATNTTATRMVNQGIDFKHFEYVFIDESGTCTETECLLPIIGMVTGEGKINAQVVLVGDPKQLGPIIHSPLAKHFKFDTSLLERLMQTCNLYKPPYNKQYITKLIYNYRSHPGIIAIPNKLFYDNELLTKGDVNLIKLAENWEHLNTKNKIPVLFHHIVGKELRESKSPSWFNVNEIDYILSYVDLILDSKFNGRKIEQKEIAIITPYIQQRSKIKIALQKRNLTKINVGTVEAFQGTEYLVTLITTVRSNTEFLDVDSKFHLGFLKNEKRFNVAMTRAKSLLIVIGNGYVLQLDPAWYEFIKYCKEMNAIRGTKFLLNTEKPQPLPQVVVNLPELIGTKISDTDFSRGNV